MNGRIYDPGLGRFLQADPIIQAPGDTQSYNRYSYVRNNPLVYTDPSGYSWTSFRDNFFKPIVAAAISYVACGPYAAGCYGAMMGAETYRKTGDFGMAVKAGVISGVSYAAFSGIANSGMNPYEAFVVGGLVGGAASYASGGKFGHGFVSAGIGASFGVSSIFKGNVPARVITAMVIGGTATEITGGKFANGAAGAAFGMLISSGVEALDVGSKTGSYSGDELDQKWSFSEKHRLNKLLKKEAALALDIANGELSESALMKAFGKGVDPAEVSAAFSKIGERLSGMTSADIYKMSAAENPGGSALASVAGNKIYVSKMFMRGVMKGMHMGHTLIHETGHLLGGRHVSQDFNIQLGFDPLQDVAREAARGRSTINNPYAYDLYIKEIGR